MNVFKEFELVIAKSLQQIPAIVNAVDIATLRLSVEPPRDTSHGDLATNTAMVLAKRVGMKPRELAEQLCVHLGKHGSVVSAEVAGPGFINLRIVDGYWRDRLRDVLRAGVDYGASSVGRGRKVNVEYVSANPTGPLHAAHARGAVFGDALASLLAKAGFEVCREYYINDAGAQVDTLARSTYLRYREAFGEDIGEIPDGHYPGEYLKAIAQALADRDGDRWLGRQEAEWLAEVRKFAIDQMVARIKVDLAALGVDMHVYASERALVESGGVDAVMKSLDEKGLLYTGVREPPKGKKPDDWEPRPQRLFKATQFGDDVDRPIQKSDGTWTYFASDVAYHLDKFERGFSEMIDVWGADHSGYVKRMQSAVRAVTGEQGALDVKICQIVHMMQDGKPVRMSKRAGTFVTLSDVIDSVGKDVVRFIMLTRRNDQPLEFDLARVTEQSRENPVFYVQYAHARCHSVLRHAVEAYPDKNFGPGGMAEVDLDCLTDSSELGLIKQLASWPRLVESAAEAHEPHRVAFYLSELAAGFHGLWNKGKDDATLRFIIEGDERLTLARLALVRGVATVVASGLGVMGVEPLEELRS
ncbi:MAG: arginine--tRNA ligase [Alphaproteobacteria bacterium]|nr:arginine--tRNA ligase [Alphaproteobacteria bacterium]